MASTAVERATRAVVLASAFAAAAGELMLGAREWGPLLLTGIVVFVVVLMAVGIYGRAATAVLFALGYVAPVLFLAAAGHFRNPYFAAWFLALLGAIVVTGGDRQRGWSFPARLKAPLVFWAVVVALSWPIVVLRETDFYPKIFYRSIPLNGLGGTPALAAVWIMNVALTHMVGLLWFDWLFANFNEGARARFKREVVVPLGVAALAGAAIGAYQGVFDITWFAGGQWPAINRAGGSLVDGNPSGMLMALWSTLFLTFVVSPHPPARAFGIVGALATWIAAWASGSRTAVGAAAIGLAVFVVCAMRLALADRLSWRPVAAAAVVAAAAIAVGGVSLRTQGVVDRVRTALPSASRQSMLDFARYQLWDRNGPYGTASLQMIADSPVVGVGLGSFHTLFPDYSYPIN